MVVVAPFTGAWIEIISVLAQPVLGGVAPFTGAWIEILAWSRSCSGIRVAPFTGAWIEIRISVCTTV